MRPRVRIPPLRPKENPVDLSAGFSFALYGGRTIYNSEEDNRFKTISEFKECIVRGGEPVFAWDGESYGVCIADSGYCIARIDGTGEKMCATSDSVLEYMLDGDRLRDVITKVTVISRNI